MGILLYCKDRGQTSCCVYGESCSNDYYKTINGELEKKSAKFLSSTNVYISYMVEQMSYDSCYRIDGLNASKCAEDCEALAKSDFAQNCERDKGLFKCCIRCIKNLSISVRKIVGPFCPYFPQ